MWNRALFLLIIALPLNSSLANDTTPEMREKMRKFWEDQKHPKPVLEGFGNPAEYSKQVDIVQAQISKCWKPPHDFGKTIRVRIVLDYRGNIKHFVPFADRDVFGPDLRLVNSATTSCQPFQISKDFKSELVVDADFSKNGVDVMYQDLKPLEKRPPGTALSHDDQKAVVKVLVDCLGGNWKNEDVEIDMQFDNHGYILKATPLTKVERGKYILSMLKKCEPFDFPGGATGLTARMIAVF